MKKEDIEDIFSSMENFSSVPPPELWGQIEEKLDKPKKKKRAILWWSAAACLLLGLMLPSVLHFNSTSGTKTINNGGGENNSVVLDDQKENLNSTKTIPAQENNFKQTPLENQSNDVENNSSIKNNINPTDRSQKTQNQETIVADSETKTNSDGLAPKSNTQKKNINTTNTEKTAIAVKENTINARQSNRFNSSSKNQTLNSDPKTANSTVAEKTFNESSKNGFNSNSKKETLSTVRKDTNPVVAEKTFQTGKTSGFNSNSKNQLLSADKKTANPVLAEKTFQTGKTNAFNSNSKNQVLSADKKTANQVLAEKTFNAGKTNAFNSNLKNQVSNSIFENQNSKSNATIASTTSNSFSNGNTKAINESTLKQKNEDLFPSKELASTQKNNSKFTPVLSKQDSVQLAELQNLEKGILAPEVKKDKENITNAKAEKWAVEVFAGVASSENYKNDKTLGNANESKQGSTYGVKTKYKINKKWAVGSGFKINELGQSIANISYMSAKNNAFFSSNDYLNQNSIAAAPQIATNSTYVFVSTTTTNALKENNIQSSNIESGNLDQSLRYIEMPLEVSYAVFTRNKASINLNTGGFVGKLISNNMALNGNSIGENANANDYVYGSTLSSTIQYRVYKKTNVFVEPAMNYYINPLNNQSFNQFQWGLNFGLNVSF